jgi:hypothetical protein
MNFLKTVQSDLRERQIFPAVVLLAVLAVAIPIGASIKLSKVSQPPPLSIVEPHVGLPKGVVPPTRELAVLNATPVPPVPRGGAEPNPFRQASASSTGSTPAASTSPVKKSASTKPAGPTSTPTTTPAKSTPAKTTPAKTTPAKTTPAKTTPPSKPKVTKPKSSGPSTKPFAPVLATPTSGPATLKATQAYSVNIDTKDAKGTHVLSNVVRLAPLPAAQSPEVIFLGVLKGGKKAAFLFTNSLKVSSQAASQLTCLPSAADCQIVELAPGQGMELAPTANTALIATFTFELVSIAATAYSSADAATQAREAVSTAGQTLLPLSTSTALATLRFDGKIGALVHQTPPAGGVTGNAGSTAATGATGSSGATG